MAPTAKVAAVGNPFLDATSVSTVDGHGRYRATVDESWTIAPLPQGGVVTAVGLRAMAHALDRPDQALRTLHTTFVGQVAHGDVEVEVDVLRRGRSMSHARAEVRNAGAPSGHVTTAAFGGPRRGFAFTDLAPPRVPPPDECPSFRDPPPDDWPVPLDPRPFWAHRVEGRPASGLPPWDPTPRTSSEQVTWQRFDEPPLLDDGTLDPLALVVLADTMPGAVGQRVGWSGEHWFAPSVDLTVHLLGPCRSSWVLGRNRARFAGEGYASVDMELWDPGDGSTPPTLVAYATQLCLFTFLSLPPP